MTDGNAEKRVIINYRGAIYVSVEDKDNTRGQNIDAAKYLFDELKKQYDAENAVNCAVCAEANNIIPPQPPKKITAESPMDVI